MIVFDWVWLGSTTSEIALTQFFWFNCIWFEAGGYDDCVRLSLIGFDYIRNCTHTIFLVQLRLIWGWRVWWLCSIEFDWVWLHQKLHSHNFFGSIAFDLRLEGMMIVFDWVWLGLTTSEIALTQFFLVQLRLIWGWRAWWRVWLGSITSEIELTNFFWFNCIWLSINLNEPNHSIKFDQ